MPADVAMMEEVVRPLSSDGRLEAGMPSPSPGTNSSHGIAPGSGKKRGSAVVKEKNRRAAAEEEDVEVVEELENGATVKPCSPVAVCLDEGDSTEACCKKMWAGQPNILVAVRLRPLLKHDRIQRGIVKVLDRKVVVIMDPNKVNEEKDVLRAKRSREKHYAFDYAFEECDGQEVVYSATTRFLIQGVLDGFNATVFAYGNTGAGKTYTMIGSEACPGIMVLTLQDLFKQSALYSRQQGLTYKVTVSFLEVYNESIRDLLSDVEEFLDLREDPIKGPIVAGITEVQAQSAEEIMELLQRGNRNRTQHPTAANEVSSRSHAVLQVVVESRDRVPGNVDNYKIGKLSLVDLAGSERAAVTQNRGARLMEGANINRSLLALGNCINALGEKGHKGHFVPYRDSKLTRLLKDSLGGNCRTVMIANISGAISSFEETLNTLKYANRAKNIKTHIRRNVLSVNHHISEYVALISGLRGEIAKLKQQLAHQGTGPPPPRSSLPSTLPKPRSERGNASADGNLHKQMECMEEVRKGIVENFRERMQLRRSLIELEDQNVQNSIEVGKRQLCIFEWQEGLTHKADNAPLGVEGLEAGHNHTPTAEQLKDAPHDLKVAWSECEQLRKAIEKNNVIKRSIGKRLRSNERQAEKLREDLTTRVNGEERRELMELQYRIGRLELENMELEQSRIVHESMMKGKDLTIQKLLLQLAVRDKIIQHQHKVLQEHCLDSKVSYSSLQAIEAGVGVESSSTGPPITNGPSPPTSAPRHHERRSSSGHGSRHGPKPISASTHRPIPPPPSTMTLPQASMTNASQGNNTGGMNTERSCPPSLGSSSASGSTGVCHSGPLTLEGGEPTHHTDKDASPCSLPHPSSSFTPRPTAALPMGPGSQQLQSQQSHQSQQSQQSSQSQQQGGGGLSNGPIYPRHGGPRQTRQPLADPTPAPTQVTASRPTLTPPHRLRPSNHGTHTTPGITASVNAASTNNSSNSNSNANTGNVNAQGSGSGNAASGGKNASLRDKDQGGVSKQLERLTSIYADDTWHPTTHADRHNRRRARGARRESSQSLGNTEDFITKNKRRIRRNSLEIGGGSVNITTSSSTATTTNTTNSNTNSNPSGNTRQPAASSCGGGGGAHSIRWKGHKKLAQVAPLPCILDPSSSSNGCVPAASPLPLPSPTHSDGNDSATQASAPLPRNRSICSNLSDDLSADSVHSASSASLVSLDPPSKPSKPFSSLKSRVRPEHRRAPRLLHHHHRHTSSSHVGGGEGENGSGVGAAAPQAPSASSSSGPSYSARFMARCPDLDDHGAHTKGHSHSHSHSHSGNDSVNTTRSNASVS